MINSFWYQLRKFGVSRIFMSIDFLIPLLFTVLLERLTIGVANYVLDYGRILDVLVGLFAFVFAALAILIAMSDSKFSRQLIKSGSYERLLFHYWFTCVVYVCSIATVLFVSMALPGVRYIDLAIIFLVSYSLCITLGLIKTTISAGIYKGRLTGD